jgi:CheY-like chemotaxis protein
MDSFMPIMSGPQASAQLRAMGFSKLIIGVTGNVMDEDVKEFEQAGADLILTKPVRMDVLNKVLAFLRIYGPVSHFNDPCEGLDTSTVELPEVKSILTCF